MSLDEIELAAAKLSPDERHVLISRLRDLDEPHDAGVEAAWDEVISRRAQEILDGKVKCLDGFAVLEELEREFL